MDGRGLQRQPQLHGALLLTGCRVHRVPECIMEDRDAKGLPVTAAHRITV